MGNVNTGFLRKMTSEIQMDPKRHPNLPAGAVQYGLRLDDSTLPLNEHIGSTITLKHTGRIECQACGRPSKKSFSQGYCYPCFKKLAQCDLCIMSPERCHFDAGTCRDNTFAETFCMQPHIVYLANSSGIKVGITKEANLPTRWIDQGAVQALPIMKVMTRQQSGFVEVAFKNYVADKTQWQRMLKSQADHVDMIEVRDELMERVKPELAPVIERFGASNIQPIRDAEVQTLTYPVLEYPTKVVSMNFDKTPTVTGQLQGIKGQYLIFDTGVINLRRFTSYEVEFIPGEPNVDQEIEQLSLL
ncbi:MAG: hypothetical protein ACI8Z1_002641 [Candidatus Azotimanducaceae bacterium]|jgi:hypothetical protein